MDPNAFERMLEEFAQLDPEIQAPAIKTFLFRARRGVCTQKDVELNLRMTNGSASRNVSYWCEYKIRDEPGMGFVSREDDPSDRRYKKLKLTKKGQDFYRHLLENDQHGKAQRKSMAG